MKEETRKKIAASKTAYWAKRKAKEKAKEAKVKPEMPTELPEGVKIGGKPDLFEMYMKGRGTGDKWIVYVQALMALAATETLQFDLANVGDTKKHVKAVVIGIRNTSRMMGFHKKVKHALIGNILHVTV